VGRYASERPLAVIDAHVRTDFGRTLSADWRQPDSREELAAALLRNHTVGAVSVAGPGAAIPGVEVAACAAVAPGADPSALEAPLASGAARCLAVRPEEARLSAGDPAYLPAYRLAARFRVPVVLVTSASGFSFADPRAMEGAVRAHPEITFVLAHDGSPLTADERDRDRWLGVRRTLAVVRRFADDPWIEAASGVAFRNRNAVLDCSNLLAGDLRADSPEQIRTYVQGPVSWLLREVADPAKLMFGSGWPSADVDIVLQAFQLALPRRTWPAVLHDNAARVFGFDAPGPRRRARPGVRPTRLPGT